MERGIGVLLTNLGTPDAPTPRAVRRYLADFLTDKRVVELPTLFWRPVLHGIVLRTRPNKSAKAYQQVWTNAGSPLAAITAAQANLLQERLGETARVRWAMRYGNPGIARELDQLQSEGCDRILIAPLYPQYSAATTASVIDAVAAALQSTRCQPAIRTLPPYFDDPAYIYALCADFCRQMAELPFVPQVLLLSFHGMPERTVGLGDPYRSQCVETARRLREMVARTLPALRIEISFQSRFGPAKWLQPYTDDVLGSLARGGERRLVVAAPGFAADCLETREELAIRGHEQFSAAGGEQFAVLDCLNDGEAGGEMLETIIRRELSGWI